MCSFCGQLFMYKEDLKKHQLCHDETEYRCFLCSRRRKNGELLRKHILSHYLYEKYGCNVCEKRFKRKKNLEFHLKYVHYVCQYCGKGCNDKLDFNDHKRTHNDLKCTFCLKTFCQKTKLKYHYQLKHGHQDFYKCTICFQRFVIKGRLLDHIKLKHNGVSKIKCKVCNTPFLYWKNYQNHFEKVHAKIKQEDEFKCGFCDFSTNVKFKLQYHVEKTSGNGFFCKKCQIQLDCKGEFDKHMEKVHKEDEKIWSCDHCSKTYASDDSLRHHLSYVHPQVVMAEKADGHPCLYPKCSKYYITKSSLARHVRKVHSRSSHIVKECNPNTVVCRTPLTRDHRETRKYQKEKQRMVTKSNEDDKGYHQEGSPNSVVSRTPLTRMHRETRKCQKEKQRVVTKSNGEHKGYHHMLEKPPETLEVDAYSCATCKLFWFSEEQKFKKHMTTHEDEVWEGHCSDCEFHSLSPENTVRHYVEEHLKVKFVLS